jgi:hypothetical protein
LLGLFALALLPDTATAQAFTCDANAAWRRVRAAYPIHSQTLAKCENKQTGEHVIVLTEPPPHLVRAKAETIVKSLFAAPVASVQHQRHQLGFNGWAEDLVIIARPRTPEQLKSLSDDLALLAVFAFGSAYKAEVEDIARLAPAKAWEAPPALEVSADELFAWLLGSNAEKLVPLEGGDGATLQERAEHNETGTYQTATPGLVVALLPAGDDGNLNDHVEDLRRFAIDTDTFLGALKLAQDRVALIGRERTSSLAAMPPLRIETLLLLASHRSAHLEQSYERTRAFAGKLLSNAGDLFGWDWAPILLSDVLIDTELGSLLNFTDNMLKGWSESGKIEYQGFPHEKPRQFPFGAAGAFKTMAAKSLTYNWNTAGVGFVSSRGDVEIFSVRNTGSLPVSYFLEGSQSNAAAKSRLVRAEDVAYKYFSSLRNPMLGRAVQYAALYQVFQAFDLRATAPNDEAPAAASITAAEEVLEREVLAALDALSNPSTPSTADYLLRSAYLQFGMKGQEFETGNKPEYADSMQKMRASAQRLRNEIAAKIALLDKEMAREWRSDYAQQRAGGGHRMPDDLQARVEDLDNEKLALVRTPEQVRRAVLTQSEHDPEGWIKTPSVVVSRGEARELVGGHNIGGMPTHVEVDAAIPRGAVETFGSYEIGRVIRINPADAAAGRDLVRVFDREVGLNDANVPKAVRALEAKLQEAPVVPQPVRALPVALDLGGASARAIRGAQPSPNAMQVGYRPGSISASIRAELESIAQQTQAQVVVARVDEGFISYRADPKSPKTTLAPNHVSLLSALERDVPLAAVGPHAKIVFHRMTADEPALIQRNLAARAKAGADAGGKPPFGGGRPPSILDDSPDPGRRFWLARSNTRRVEGRANAERSIRAEGSDAPRMLATEPKWAEAKVTFIEPDSVSFANAPDMAGAGRHITVVRVPMVVKKAGISRILDGVFTAIASFREALTGVRKQAIDAAVSKLFRDAGGIDLREGLTRYKTLMMDEFKADDIRINRVPI